MKIIKAGYEYLEPISRNEVLQFLEMVGRTCYKSEDQITANSAGKFVTMLIGRGHEAMLEHYKISVKFICDRGVSHEIVRHRIASYAQESTRYCNYSKDKFNNEITFIEPLFFDPEERIGADNRYDIWRGLCRDSERAYFRLLALGAKPEEARSVLPNSLKTEIVVTMNLREWRHFFKLRTALAAHPQMREITIPLLESLKIILPEIFEDIEVVPACQKP